MKRRRISMGSAWLIGEEHTDSSDFGNVNAAVQTVAIQLGLHQDYVEMKEKYPNALGGKNVIYSYPDSQRHILDCYSKMASYKYSFFGLLEGGKVDIGMLKVKLTSLDPLSRRNAASVSV
ncbi:unnamed protein product [Lactuca saligna]|uniref:Uncharacterized protein n=1 Tax=Lactuca saligna TaxID=75948 RepID=A0AA35V1X8_LACSI|nr:unnamed protein product [Lactuca saligna]